MRNFDGVLVNMIIDELAERSGPSEPFDRVPISNYSTVSSKWVKRTQGYHFRFIHLAGQKGVKKWCTSIQADPLGVSRHVRRFNLVGIDTLEGFEKHIRALTRVQEVELSDCGILRSLSDVEVFTLLGSSLVRLDIDGALTTPHVMASLLAGLPRLRKLSASGLEVECDPNPTALPPKIPFVEDANSLDLLMTKYCLGGLSWIPPTARFRDLGIEAYCINKDSALVNNWLTSSGGCLQWLTIREDSWCTPLTPLPQHCLPLTVRFPSRSPFPLPGPLEVYSLGSPATPGSTRLSWAICRSRPSLALLVSAFECRSAFARAEGRGDQP